MNTSSTWSIKMLPCQWICTNISQCPSTVEDSLSYTSTNSPAEHVYSPTFTDRIVIPTTCNSVQSKPDNAIRSGTAVAKDHRSGTLAEACRIDPCLPGGHDYKLPGDDEVLSEPGEGDTTYLNSILWVPASTSATTFPPHPSPVPQVMSWSALLERLVKRFICTIDVLSKTMERLDIMRQTTLHLALKCYACITSADFACEQAYIVPVPISLPIGEPVPGPPPPVPEDLPEIIEDLAQSSVKTSANSVVHTTSPTRIITFKQGIQYDVAGIYH